MLVNKKKKMFFGRKLYLIANIRYRAKNKSTFFNFEDFYLIMKKIQMVIWLKTLSIRQY